MSEDTSKREDREFQCEMAKLQVDFEFAFSVMIGVIAILFTLWVIFIGSTLLNLIVSLEIGVAVIGLAVSAYAKERRFKAIREKYKLFQKMENKKIRRVYLSTLPVSVIGSPCSGGECFKYFFSKSEKILSTSSLLSPTTSIS
jgi:c-di-AMP phosphodiesterase-like protein